MKLDEYIKTRGNVDVAPQELDKLLGVKVGRWKPKYSDEYWFVDSRGCVSIDGWSNSGIDNYKYYTNNCFPTEKAAEQKLRVIQTEIELRKYAEEHNEGIIDWKDGEQYRWRLYYSFYTDYISCNGYSSEYTPNQIYFTSEEIARAAVNEIGEERVIEYLRYGSGVND